MSQLIYIQEAADILRNVSGTTEADFEGASAEQLGELEGLLPGDYTIPAAIAEWLAFGGIRCGEFFRTRDLSYRSMHRLLKTRFKDCRDPLLMEDEDEFDEDLLIFYENQAMFIAFCRLGEGENPPVYLWDESMDGIEDAVEKFPTFSAYLAASAATHKQALEYRP